MSEKSTIPVSSSLETSQQLPLINGKQSSVSKNQEHQNLQNQIAQERDVAETLNAITTELSVDQESSKPLTQKPIWSRVWDYLVEEQKESLGEDSKMRIALDFIFKVLPDLSADIAMGANLMGSVIEMMPVPAKIIDFVEKVNRWITSLSFTPYAAKNMLTQARNKSFWGMATFSLESPAGIMGALGDVFTVRGISAGANQTCSAVAEVDGSKYASWSEGFTRFPKTLWKITKELFTRPIEFLLRKKSFAHYTVLSSIGDIAASTLYMASKRKLAKLSSFIRMIASAMFDFPLLEHKTKSGRTAGKFFIAEAAGEFFSKFFDGRVKLSINQFFHFVGRAALRFYRRSYEEAAEMEKTQPVVRAVEAVANSGEPVANLVSMADFSKPKSQQEWAAEAQTELRKAQTAG